MNSAFLTLAIIAATPTTTTAKDRGVLAPVVAVFPGVIAHGAGHFVLGERETAWTLLSIEGAGIASILAGGTGLALTGGSDKTVVPFAWMMMQGVGLFGVSWLADLYGTMSPKEGFGTAQRRTPKMRLELGYRAIADPVFSYTNLSLFSAQSEWRVLRFGVDAWSALDDDNQRVRGHATWRVFGPRSRRTAPGGDYLDLRFGLNWHRYGTEDFSMTTGEFAFRGRLDGRHIASTLRGLFFEAELGLAGGATSYGDLSGEATGLLLGGFGLGIYLGHARDSWGELTLMYDHRHDGYLAGAKLPSLGSGIPGHLVSALDLQIFGPWGFRLEAAAGSSWMGGASVVYQLGGSR